ncbi:MAG: hypothetical protein HZA52_04445 [Planctomycetes bacterium]|nr:hypothetical protein [Planctomycetota bacterium]
MRRLQANAVAAGIALALASCTATRRIESALEFERSAVAVIDRPDEIELVCVRGAPLTVVVQQRLSDKTTERTLELADGATVRLDVERPTHGDAERSVRLDLLRFGDGHALVKLTIEGGTDVAYDARSDDPDFE